MPTPLNIGNSRVLESREVGDGKTIRRRRESPDGRRFTTYERIEKPNLAVIKKDGSRELFDRDKLASAIKQSVGKFFASDIEVEDVVTEVEEAVYNLGDSETFSKQIGEIVLDKLEERNQVAYVRFASVFHDFKTLDDFVKILASRQKKPEKETR
jgi:transcriptional repressor NrdR